MPGPVQRDSWSRCEPQSMLYDTIRNPTARHIPPKPAPAVDTIESTQQRLNRQMMDRIQNFRPDFPQETFVAVVRVGKYVFLAVMLPPYLCLYGIPHWFLVRALPQMMLFVKNECFRVGRFIQEISKNIADLMRGLMEQMIADALRMMNQRAKNLWGHFKKTGQTVNHSLSRLNQHVKSKVAAARKMISTKVKKIQEVVRGTSVPSVQHVKERTKHYVYQVAKALHFVVQSVDQAVVAPIYQWFNTALNQVDYGFHLFGKHLQETAIGVKRGIKKAAQPIISAKEATKAWMDRQAKRFVQAAVDPVVVWTQEKIHKLQDIVRHTWSAMVAPIAEVAGKAKIRLEQFFTKTSQFAKQSVSFIPSVALQAGSLLLKLIPKRVKDRFKRDREAMSQWGRSFKGLRKGIAAGFKALDEYRHKVLEKGRALMSWMLNLISKGFKFLVSLLVDLPERIKRASLYSWNLSTQSSRKMGMGLRLSFAFLWASMGYGMIMTHNLVSELTGSHSKHKK